MKRAITSDGVKALGFSILIHRSFLVFDYRRSRGKVNKNIVTVMREM